MLLKELLQSYQLRVENHLNIWLPSENTLPQKLHAAMRYSSLDGGKRIRPALVYATGHALGVALEKLDGPACAIELIHAYSLVHDDLPAMDDDALRRGKPTCHIAYDEATAILTGDALQTLAFYILANDKHMVADASLRLRMVAVLAQNSGSIGMVGGQAIDLYAVGKELNLSELKNMHLCKTGALIRASILLGALSFPDINDNTLEILTTYGNSVGLAFQIQDDILDIESDTATLGKAQGADVARNKPTYPALMGMDAAKKLASELHNQALEALQGISGDTQALKWLANYIIARKS